VGFVLTSWALHALVFGELVRSSFLGAVVDGGMPRMRWGSTLIVQNLRGAFLYLGNRVSFRVRSLCGL
jgi:hypothetical protein